MSFDRFFCYATAKERWPKCSQTSLQTHRNPRVFIFIDYDSKSPTYSKSVTIECDFLSEAVTAWAALTKKNREGAYIRTASDRRFKASDIKKLQKSPGF